MSNRFHISTGGSPAECVASVRSCPRGGEETYMSSLGLEGPARPSVRTARELGVREELYDDYVPLEKGTRISDDRLGEMVNSRDPRVRMDLIDNAFRTLFVSQAINTLAYTDTDGKVLDRLKKEGPHVQRHIYRRGDLYSTEELSEMVNSSNPAKRAGVAHNPNTSQRDLELLYRDKDETVRESLAMNENIDDGFVNKIIRSPQSSVSALGNVAERDSLSDVNVDALVKRLGQKKYNSLDRGSVYRKLVEHNPTERVLEKILEEDSELMDRSMFYALKENDRVSSENLVKLAKNHGDQFDGEWEAAESFYQYSKGRGFDKDLGWRKEGFHAPNGRYLAHYVNSDGENVVVGYLDESINPDEWLKE